jgi:hypothetical protein
VAETKNKFCTLTGVLVALSFLLRLDIVHAIDMYEIQVYTVETTPQRKLTLELHSNGTVNAVGQTAKEEMRPHEIHETLETTYGLLPHLEIGQYLAFAKFIDSGFGYAGSRTKLHFGIGDPDAWPIAFGGNLEIAYMRKQADPNSLSMEIRPILQKNFGKLSIAVNFAFEKALQGPGTHDGFGLSPSASVSYELLPWLTPALEYYGDIGPVRNPLPTKLQQHFVVPTLNFDFLPQLELNFGVGIGTTEASRGVFIKSIIGWTF